MAIIFLFFTIGVGIFFVTRTLGDVSSFFSAFYQQFDDSMHLSLTGPILDLPPYTPVLEVRSRSILVPLRPLSAGRLLPARERGSALARAGHLRDDRGCGLVAAALDRAVLLDGQVRGPRTPHAPPVRSCSTHYCSLVHLFTDPTNHLVVVLVLVFISPLSK